MISSLCIGIPTCVSVTKELLIDALHYHKNIKRIHLIADEQTRIKRLQER
jgi:hypothetical protein